MRPRPLRVRAVSVPTASPSKNHCGTPTAATPSAPSPSSGPSTRPTPCRAFSNCPTCRNSCTTSPSSQSTVPRPRPCSGVIKNSACRGRNVTKPLLTVVWLWSTTEMGRGLTPRVATPGPCSCSSRAAVRWAAESSPPAYSTRKWGVRTSCQRRTGGFWESTGRLWARAGPASSRLNNPGSNNRRMRPGLQKNRGLKNGTPRLAPPRQRQARRIRGSGKAGSLFLA